MTPVEFENLNWLHLLWTVPLIALISVYGVWQRRRALRAFAASRLIGVLAPHVGWTRIVARLALIVLSLAFMIVALLGPRWGEQQQTIFRRNIDVMILLDVSRSMLARDIAPNRLERAKLSITEDLLPALAGDRVGLISFAGAASLTCPLTNDYGFLRLVLDEVSTRSAPIGGTMIGDAIRRAADSFKSPLETHRVILLITDGEDHDSYPVEAARAAWNEHKIPIVAVALGDEREGARIPIESGSGSKYLEHSGQTVWTRANFDQLRQIAAVSELNAFIPVGTKNFDLGRIYKERIVPAIRFKERAEERTVTTPSQAHWFSGAALLLLLIESFLKEGPRAAPSSAAALRATRERAA